MHIIKKPTGYHTEDHQVFATLGEARGHAQRLAIAHYLLVMRHQLHEDTGPIPQKVRDGLLDLGDAIADIFAESAKITYENGEAYVQRPVFVSKAERLERDGRVLVAPVYKNISRTHLSRPAA